MIALGGTREHWARGSVAWFELRRDPGGTPAGDELAARSHRAVVVVGPVESPEPAWSVRFGDGATAVVLVDELVAGPEYFSRPAGAAS